MITLSSNKHGEQIEMSTEDEYLPDVLEFVRRFLLAASYSISGNLEVIQEDECVTKIRHVEDEDELDDTLTDGE